MKLTAITFLLLVLTNASFANSHDCKEITFTGPGGGFPRGELCRVTFQEVGVYGVSPLETLKRASEKLSRHISEICKKRGLKKALFVENFKKNSFQVDSLGSRNTTHGSNVTIGGSFACVHPRDSYVFLSFPEGQL